MRALRCPGCGVAEGEEIEERVAHIGLGDNVYYLNEIVRVAYFDSAEDKDGNIEHRCTECRHKFSRFWEVEDCGTY